MDLRLYRWEHLYGFLLRFGGTSMGPQPSFENCSVFGVVKKLIGEKYEIPRGPSWILRIPAESTSMCPHFSFENCSVME